jgi:hypothetical protein
MTSEQARLNPCCLWVPPHNRADEKKLARRGLS